MSDIIARPSKQSVSSSLTFNFDRNVEIIRLKEKKGLSNHRIGLKYGLTAQRISKIYNTNKDRLRPFIEEVNRG